MINLKFKLLFLVAIFSSLINANETKTYSHGWVETRESADCFAQGLNRYGLLNNCYLMRTEYLDKLIKKKLLHDIPSAKYDLKWWNQEKIKVKKKCVQEAIDAQNRNPSDISSSYEEADVSECMSNIYSDINRSLVDYHLSVKP